MKKNIFSIFIVFILLFNNTFTWIVYSVDDVFGKLENISEDFDLDDNIWDLWENDDDIVIEEVIDDDIDLDNKDDAELEPENLEDDIDLEVELEYDSDVDENLEIISSGYNDDEIIDEILDDIINEEVIDDIVSDDSNWEIQNEEIQDEEKAEDISSTDDEVQELETQDPSLNIQNNEEEKEWEQWFLSNLWEIIKSFFLVEKNGYLVWSETIDNITISIEAEKWVFPEWTEVVIKWVSEEKLESIQTSLVEDETNNITEDAQILAFDISFVYSWEEIQPEREISVKFNYKENLDFQWASEKELSVYHIDDETDEWIEIQVTNKNGDEIEILATEFSIYVLTLTQNDNITLTLDPGDWIIITWDNIVVDEYGNWTITSSDGNVILPDATRENHVFVWWYTSQTPSLQNFVWTWWNEYHIDSNITLYASWCNDGYTINTDKTTCILEWNLKTILDQNPNFTWWEIEIPKPNSISYGPSSYIIMDRNLWATNTNISSEDSYWYMYQWGNNYGFPGTWTSLPSSQVATKKIVVVNLTEFWPTSDGKIQYYSGVFVIAPDNIGLSNNERYDWATVANNNIWWNTTNTNEVRQWPCPDGWHVPSMEEWSGVMAYWKAWSWNWSMNLNNFISDLKLPRAGSRARSTANLQKTGEWWFYTSTSTWKTAYAFTFANWANSVKIDAPNNRVDGLSVRCIKNWLECGSNEHIVWDECVSNITTWFCMTWAEIDNWYYTWMDLEINISWNGSSWDIPVCDIACNEWYFLINDQCFPIEDYTITFELNWWLWYDWYAGNRTAVVEAWNDASTARPIIDPYKNNYMFMWWFDESSNSTTRYKFQWTIITWDLTLTAHWAPFNNIVYTWIVEWEEKRVILMDRNLWAIATWAWVVTTPESYWYYYQWWNNYWFYYDNGTSINTTVSQNIYNANWFGPWNWFYGEIFTKGFIDWSSVSVNNLWWWVWDQENNNYDDWNKRYNRQGPCPKGYHVPSLWEWHKLIRLFMNNEYPDHNSTNILNTSWKNNIWNGNDANYALTQAMFNDILNTFYIPSAWRVTTAYAWNRMWSNPGSDWYRAPFWSSTIINDSRALWFEMRFKDVKFNLWWWDDERAGAKPVRCFKDNEDYTVLWKNYDGTVLETDYYVYEWATPSYDEPENPTRNGYEFIWWYLSWDENQTVVNLSGQTVTWNRTYMAKYILNSGKYEVVLYTWRWVESVSGGGIFDVGDSIIITGTLKTWYENLIWTWDFDTGEFIMPESNVIMTGIATPINYTISYNVWSWYITWQKTTYTIEDSFVIPDPTRTWFEFLWWSWTNLSVLTTGLEIEQWTYWNLYYEAIWRELWETTYNIHHYIKVAWEDRYQQYWQVIVYTWTAGSVIILTWHEIQIPCMTYTWWSLDLSFSWLTNQIWTTTVLDNWSRNIYLYYTRNTYTLTLDKDIGIFSISGSGVYECGQTVTIEAIPKTWYHFKRWDGVLDDSW